MYWPRIELEVEDDGTSAAVFQMGSPTSPVLISRSLRGDSPKVIAPEWRGPRCAGRCKINVKPAEMRFE